MSAWTERTLWALRRPVEEVPVAAFDWLLDASVWRWGGRRWQISLRSVLDDRERYRAHAEKVERADTRHPIHVTDRGGCWVILDGYHRLLKSLPIGAPTIRVVW